jgi:prophage regulatory protein
MPSVYITDRDIAARYRTHRTWAWRKLKTDPSFPKPIKLTQGCTRWKLDAIEAWEAAQTRG